MSNPTPTKKASTLEFIAVFLLLFVLTQYGLQYFFPSQFGGKKDEMTSAIQLTMQSKKVTEGRDPVVFITNTTSTGIVLPARCPQPPVTVSSVQLQSDGTEAVTEFMANETSLPCTDVLFLEKGKKTEVNLAPWKYTLFAERGTYELSIDPPAVGTGTVLSVASTRFTLTEPGFFTKIFRTFVTKPLFNSLIFIASWMPSHHLGLAIIVLTVLIKLLLLLPNQHALEGQRKLQLLQPKMDELKRKYQNDPQKLQEETMRLWKEMKINPFQSCLPTLLQLPILIGLFYVIRDGATIATSQHLLYSFYTNLPATFFTTTFLGLNLLKPNWTIFPLLLVILQFIQMKMMLAKNKKQDVITIEPTKKKTRMPELNQQTILTYVMPLLIGYFALTFPAAVSLYWAVSTLFGIAQQWYVLQEKLKV